MSAVSRVVTVHEAKTNLSRLMVEAEQGQTIGIARGQGEPTVILAKAPMKRRPAMGWMSGSMVPDDFDTMGQEQIVAMFEGAEE